MDDNIVPMQGDKNDNKPAEKANKIDISFKTHKIHKFMLSY